MGRASGLKLRSFSRVSWALHLKGLGLRGLPFSLPAEGVSMGSSPTIRGVRGLGLNSGTIVCLVCTPFEEFLGDGRGVRG